MDRKKIIKISCFSVIVIGVMGLGYRYFFQKKNIGIFDEKENIEVDTQIVEFKPITLKKTYIGNITPINSVSVLPFVSGFIDKVLVSGGQNVKVGDTLFIIRQAKYKANMDAAYAQVLEAKANFENAKTFYERMQMAGSKAVSKTDIDNARTAYLSAEASLTSALSNYDLSKINYDYTIINSSINGVVGDVNITKGDYVSPESSPLVKIIQFNPIRVVFSIADKEYMSERHINPKKIFDGWTVKLKLSNDAIYDKVGKIRFLDNEVSPATSSIKVYADFENFNKILVANAYVDVIMEKTIDNAILLPQSAVYFTPDEVFVYTLDNGRAIKKIVDIGQTINNSFVINKGLITGDKVILDTLSEFDLKQNILSKEK